jgi:hypothetical protein
MAEVVGLFDDRSQAEAAIARLADLDVDESSVGYLDYDRNTAGGVTTREHHESDIEASDTQSEAAKGVGGGAVGGAAVGAGTGLLASAGMLVIPGIGPFLAAGTLAATLGATAAGAAGGAVLGGAAGAIFGSEDHETHETSSHFRDRVSAGASLVSVDVVAGAERQVIDAMSMAGASRVNVYGDSGWVDFDGSALS